ncbi:MAG: MBOAT family O-acyltransferase [Bacteroidota bacterium]
MLFNSLDFGIFLPIVFALYWLIPREKFRWQNILILGASYFFYGWWDWRFLFLISFSSALDYTVGRLLDRSKDPGLRKWFLAISVVTNLGLLGFFKYYNFFVESFIAGFSFLGLEIQGGTLELILPVGISFYTFQTLSYTIDIYRGKLRASRDPIQFFAFVSFFPQLVAGPIERATSLLPQFAGPRTFDAAKASDGGKQILWGFVKKVVIGDNCASAIYWMFAHPAEVSSGEMFLGAMLFALRCYGDFSGYSDIAIGTARLFGFNLTQNFAFPYFSRDIAEFWRRWHISLSTWLRDYLYIPLGGNRGGKWKTVRNVLLTFLICGFWHGADWKFVVWGGVNGLYFIPLLLAQRHRQHVEIIARDRWLPTPKELGQVAITFIFVSLSVVFLRAASTEDAFFIIYCIFRDPLAWFSPDYLLKFQSLLVAIGIFMTIEWIGRREEYALAGLVPGWPRAPRWLIYAALAVLVVYYLFSREEFEFVYFHF